MKKNVNKFNEMLKNKGLESMKITAVIEQDPNNAYVAENACYGKFVAKQKISTDGEVDFRCKKKSDRPKSGYNEEITHTVTGASWAIVYKYRRYMNRSTSSSVLYTQRTDFDMIVDELKRQDDVKKLASKIERDIDFCGKKYATMAQMRSKVEYLIGATFPLTAAELPGKPISAGDSNWAKHVYNGITVNIRTPEDIDGREFLTLEEMRMQFNAYVEYCATLATSELHLYANKNLIGTIQLKDYV